MEPISRRLPNLLGYGSTVELLLPHILSSLGSGDTILVKGARGTKTFRLVDALYRHYGQEAEAMAYPLRPYLSV